VPLLTFVLGPSTPEQAKFYPDLKGGELAENLIYLGPSGIYPCSSGLRIAYLGGAPKLSGLKIGYTNAQVAGLESEGAELGNIDVLLTRQWPQHVTSYAAVPTGCDTEGCPLIARLARSIRPRYHFAASKPSHYERLPYRNHVVLQEAPRQCTRFLSLDSVGNPRKQKWLYAFTATPAIHCNKEELTREPADVTENPYNSVVLPAAQASEGINQFFFGGKTEEKRGKKRQGEDEESRAKRKPPVPTGPCWFCLKGSEVEKQLIVSVGEHTYLSLAKGGLVPHHLMVLPIHHYQTSLDLEKEANEELQAFKKALRQMFSSLDCACVFYERNYRTSHMQLHAVPVPKERAGAVSAAFQDLGQAEGMELQELPPHASLSDAVGAGVPFLHIEPPGANPLLCRVRKGYNMRFDREVLACSELLNVPDRVDWKQCQTSKEEEAALAKKLRDMFKKYDFTIDSDSSDSDEE